MSGEKMKKGRQGFNLEPTLVSDDLVRYVWTLTPF